MKIVISTLYFYPDESGIAIYATDFARYLAEKGHDVRVITGFSFYPAWKKRTEDKYKLTSKETFDRMKVYRGYTYVPAQPTTFKRILQELLLIVFSLFNYIRVGKADYTFVFTTPVIFGTLGAFLKRFLGYKLIINVQDFQVEAAKSLNMVKGAFLIKLLARLEKYSYRKADFVSTISSGMLQTLKDQNVSESKQLLWPNWIDLKGLSNNRAAKGRFRSEHNIPDECKIVVYAGNIGLKQGLNVLIDLASAFQAEENIQFYIIGQGADLENVKNYHRKTRVPNISFLPFLDSAMFNQMMVDVDMCFISQKHTDKDIYFPSKLLGIMGHEKPILLSADTESELYKVLNEKSAALVADYGDIETLKKHVDTLLHDDQKINQVIKNARNFVEQFDRESVLKTILKLIS